MSTPPARTTIPGEVIDWVERLHGVVDELVAPIAAAHASRLTCHAGCHGCCSDGLSVFEIEAAAIERHHADLVANGVPHEAGGCAFLDERGECRVYDHRPYVCRTQGLPLRWLERDEDGELAEVRDVCPLNAEGFRGAERGEKPGELEGRRLQGPSNLTDGPALEELAADECWTVGPIEERLATRQSAIDGGEGRRVPLRSLFRSARRHLPIMP